MFVFANFHYFYLQCALQYVNYFGCNMEVKSMSFAVFADCLGTCVAFSQLPYSLDQRSTDQRSTISRSTNFLLTLGAQNVSP